MDQKPAGDHSQEDSDQKKKDEYDQFAAIEEHLFWGKKEKPCVDDVHFGKERRDDTDEGLSEEVDQENEDCHCYDKRQKNHKASDEMFFHGTSSSICLPYSTSLSFE